MVFQFVRVPAIVGIDEREQLAAGMANPGISRAGEAAVLGMVDYADARVTKPPSDANAAVGRPVVDDQQFEIGKALLDHRANGFTDEALDIKNGHDDTNLGHGKNLHQLGLSSVCARVAESTSRCAIPVISKAGQIR